MKKKSMSKAEFAGYKGFSKPYVSKLVRLGMIILEKDGRINPEKADKMLAENSDPARKEIKNRSYTESRAIREHYRSLNEKLDYQIKTGEFINADTARQLWERVTMACRSRLLALPSKVAPIVVHLKSIPEVKDQIEKLIHEALNDLSRLDIDKYAKEMIDEDKAEDKPKKNKKRKGGGQ